MTGGRHPLFHRFSRKLVRTCLFVTATGGVALYAGLGPAAGRGFTFGALGGSAAAWLHTRAVAGTLHRPPDRIARRARRLWALRFIVRAIPPCIAAFSPRFPLQSTVSGLLAVQLAIILVAATDRIPLRSSLPGNEQSV